MLIITPLYPLGMGGGALATYLITGVLAKADQLKLTVLTGVRESKNVVGGWHKGNEGYMLWVSEDRFLTSSLVGHKGDMAGEIRVTPLDALIPYSKMRRPVLIKIDVEGFEINVLKGAMRMFQNLYA